MTGVEISLKLNQSNRLLMSHEMRQAINVLQMSSVELNSFLNTVSEENPLLEVKRESLGTEEKGHAEFKETHNDSPYESINDFYIKKSASQDYIDYKQSSQKYIQSFNEKISQQIEVEFSGNERLLAYQVLDSADDKGLINKSQIQTSELLGAVLTKMQFFEPVGCFTVTIAESIKTQLKFHGTYDSYFEIILDNLHIANSAKLAEICGLSEEEVADRLLKIRTCDPCPRKTYHEEQNESYIIPDVTCIKDPFGGFKIELNSASLPKVLANKEYYEMVSSKSRKIEDIKYFNDSMKHADTIVSAVEQRAQTTLKVAKIIIEKQLEFLEKGVLHMKPMKLADIAGKLNIHESTVMRVVNGKFIQTPRGTFELKYFFSNALNSSDSEENFSSMSVKQVIKNLIDTENKGKPLSDEKISQILKKSGIDIARRTVMKYRDNLGYLTSSQRKLAI